MASDQGALSDLYTHITQAKDIPQPNSTTTACNWESVLVAGSPPGSSQIQSKGIVATTTVAPNLPPLKLILSLS